MDDFQESAKQMRARGTLMVGATFGIFLTLGNAWYFFLQAAVEAIVPSHQSEVVTALLFASIASLVCISILLCIVKLDQTMANAGRAVNSKNVRSAVARMHLSQTVNPDHLSIAVPPVRRYNNALSRQGRERRLKTVAARTVSR